MKQVSPANAPTPHETHWAPYDPLYDPLTAKTPGHGQDYAPTYWTATAGPAPADDGPITADIDADVVVIGSGFTGLACTLFLAREHGIKATVLEANRAAWGCTSRNGGQALASSGRLPHSQWIRRWGLDTAKRMHAETLDAMETFKTLIREIDCDPQPGGHLYVAHKTSALRKLETEAALLREKFDYPCKILSRDQFHEQYMREAEAVGAMHEPEGIGIHPLKLAHGYLRAVRAGGATVHPASPVTGWETRGGVHHLRTPGGTVKARAVAVATGGYTSQSLHPRLRSRIMPILSNSMVTRPLTAHEIAACNFRTHQILTDTRILRFYYRLLPDNRIQIGTRAAITGADAANPKHQRLLEDGIARKFPPLTGIEIDYSWWGWVDVSHDMMPRVTRAENGTEVFYALGYGGNGVMYSAQAGRRMAQLVAGQCDGAFDLPLFTSALPGHPLAPFRRLGQAMLYRWYHLQDER
ncbi:MAG: NAD(P)/FAD-dependent oxidoreductase, partial [Dichotomicrobium sp.]